MVKYGRSDLDQNNRRLLSKNLTHFAGLEIV